MHHSRIQKRWDVRWDVCSWKLTKMEDKRLRDLMNMKIREGCCPRTCKVRCANTRTWWRRNSAKDTEEAWWRNKSCVSKGKLEAIPNRTRQNGTVDQTRFVTAVCGSGKGLDWFSCQCGQLKGVHTIEKVQKPNVKLKSRRSWGNNAERNVQ